VLLRKSISKDKHSEFKEKEASSDFVNKEHRERELQSVLQSKKDAETAQRKIDRMKGKADNLLQKVIDRIEEERSKPVITEDNLTENTAQNETAKPSHRTDKLSKLSRSERKLISKIYDIILNSTDKNIAEQIISRIEENFQ